MKKLKKLLCGALMAVMGSSFCGLEAAALFGNTHFNLGKTMIESYNNVLTESEKNAFLSGLVYADIGRFKFDKESGIASDSYEFVQRMKKFAQTPEEQWFVRGFDVHVLQDNQTGRFLTEILGRKSSSYFEYITECSLLDSYFTKKNGGLHNEFLDSFDFEQVISGLDLKTLSKEVDIPEDTVKDFVMLALSDYSTYPSKNALVMYDNLIKDTYQSFGVEISLDQIHKQAANVVGAFIVSSILIEKNEIPMEIAAIIESKSYEFAQYCMKRLEDTE